MSTSYESDVVAWASEQAAVIRANLFAQLDLKHIAEDIEDLGKTEQRELASRMAILFAYLLKWQYQLSRLSKSWQFIVARLCRSDEKRLYQPHGGHGPGVVAV